MDIYQSISVVVISVFLSTVLSFVVRNWFLNKQIAHGKSTTIWNIKYTLCSEIMEYRGGLNPEEKNKLNRLLGKIDFVFYDSEEILKAHKKLREAEGEEKTEALVALIVAMGKELDINTLTEEAVKHIYC